MTELVEAYRIYNELTEELVAKIYYDEARHRYSAELLVEGWHVPVMFMRLDGTFNRNPTSEAIENFLKSRVLPENRDGLKEILLARGICKYSWQELIKLNKGRTNRDKFRVEVVE